MTTRRQPLHFSHANSFPASTYRKLFANLEADFDIGYIDTLGHNPDYPVTDCWPHLVEESLRYIRERYEEPVVAVGHSLGGFLSFFCAIEQPELFKAVVLLDSPIFSRQVSSLLWLSKRFGFIERISPGRGSLKRRREWPNVDAVETHFKGKGLFSGFDADCLRDYAEHGTVPHDDRVRLKFDPEIEYRIYCGLPHNLPNYRGKLSVPTGFIGGTTSEYVRKSDLRHMKKDFGIALEHIEGGHLFPFESPVETANRIRAMLHRLIA